VTFPAKLATAIDDVTIEVPRAGRFTRDEVECLGARFHSPSPLVVVEVPLAPDGVGETAWLCGTCSDNLAVLQALLREYDGNVEWPVRREFGNAVRALALKGWEDYVGRRTDG